MKSRRPKLYVAAALAASVLTAFSVAIDNFILHNALIHSNDSLAGPLVYIFTGYWSAVGTNFLANVIMGQRMDARYKCIQWGSTKTQGWAFLAGAAIGFASLAYFIGSSTFDLSTVLPLSSASILYLACYDVMKGTMRLRYIILPAATIIAGSALVSANDTNTAGISIGALLVILIFDQGLEALGEVASQEAVRNTNTVNLNSWWMLWSALSISMIAGIFAIATNRLPVLIITFQTGLALNYAPWLAIRMILLYFSEILRHHAREQGPVSEVSLLISTRVILAVPLALVISTMASTAFGVAHQDPLIWLIKTIGSIIVLFGIMLLCREGICNK